MHVTIHTAILNRTYRYGGVLNISKRMLPLLCLIVFILIDVIHLDE